MIVNILVLSPHTHEYGEKSIYLSTGQGYKLDLSKVEELEELKYIVSGLNPNKPLVYINEEEVKEVGLDKEILPESPISFAQEPYTLDSTIDGLSAESQLVEQPEFFAPDPFSTPNKVDPFESVDPEPLLLDPKEDEPPTLTEAVEITLHSQITRDERASELKSLDLRKLKALAKKYTIPYTDLDTTVADILEQEYPEQ